MQTIMFLAGLIFSLFGGLVTLAFWWPRLVNRQVLRQQLGSRYLLVYLIYLANGPFLTLAGLFLLLHSR